MRSLLTSLFQADHTETAYLTGLRAYAALAVVMIHTLGGLRGISHYLDSVIDSGKYGVEAFYFLSGFTITLSLIKRTEVHFGEYFLRRCLRILPLYIIVLLFLYSISWRNFWSVELAAPNDIFSLFMHLSFLNLFDLRYANNVIGVEWSISIEFFYYLMIPIFLWLFNQKNRIYWVGLFIVFLGSLLLMPKSLPENQDYLYRRWSFQSYLFLYLFSVYCALNYKKILQIIDEVLYKKYLGLTRFYGYPIVVSCLSVLLLWAVLGSKGGQIFIPLWLAAFIFLYQNTQGWQLFLSNKTVLWFGNISFSIYLIHLPLYEFVFSLFVEWLGSALWGWLLYFVSLLLICSMTYLIVEKPFVKLSRRIRLT